MNKLALWRWPAAVLAVALWLGAGAALSDEPTELDAMRATAAAANDVEREGALLAGIAP